MQKNNLRADIVLIGAGIMSGTLGILLKELNPLLSIVILEKLDAVGLEKFRCLEQCRYWPLCIL